jgi:hypothetical protein
MLPGPGYARGFGLMVAALVGTVIALLACDQTGWRSVVCRDFSVGPSGGQIIALLLHNSMQLA